MKFKTSVICSTYNDPAYLELVLDSLLYQTSLNFELLIADDGSDSETKRVIKRYKDKSPFVIKHIWHNDKGWRKAKIHNQAIMEADGDLLIFIDGDCILAPCFISDHQSIFTTEQRNYVLMCRRVELGPKVTKIINFNNYRKILFSLSMDYMNSLILNDTHGGLRKFSVQNPFVRKLLKADSVNDLIGANFSIPKEKLISINGFNEDTDELGGSEDGDIFVRLRNTNTKLIGKKYFAPMFHKFHGRNSRVASDKYYQEILKDFKYIYSKNGLNKS